MTDALPEGCEPICVRPKHGPVRVFQEPAEVGDRNGAVVDEDSTAHCVEQSVGEVVGGCHAVCGALAAVRGIDQPAQTIGPITDMLLDVGDEIGVTEQLRPSFLDFQLGLMDVGDDQPRGGTRRVELDGAAEQVVAAYPLGQILGLQGSAGAEVGIWLEVISTSGSGRPVDHTMLATIDSAGSARSVMRDSSE